ncbi:MAG: hypothetical protein QX203_06750 [Methylococcaceae bacterium]
MAIKTVINIDLPNEVIELKPKIKAFEKANRREKLHTEWFVLCSQSPSITNWNNRDFAENRINDIEFSALSARAYLQLFNSHNQGIPYCSPSFVIESSQLAKKLKNTLHGYSFIPPEAKEQGFIAGLIAGAERQSCNIATNGIKA